MRRMKFKVLKLLLSLNVLVFLVNIQRDKWMTREAQRITNISFLKVHKAGSTTMQNMFFRFGIRHDLNVIVPKTGNIVSDFSDVIPIKPPNKYNIFACHTLFYHKVIFENITSTDSVKIAIVREPIDRMISAAYYYRDVWNISYLQKIPSTNFIHNLIDKQYEYDTRFFSLTRNSMGGDFGFHKDIQATETKVIQSHLESLNSDFSLVMIMERFDESLVMMKRLLSWSFIDIIYLQKNSHGHKPVVLSKDEQDTARKNNFLDFAIYEYFTDIFDKKVKSMDNNFQDEVTYFKKIIAKGFTFCSGENMRDNSKLFIRESRWNDEFHVTGVDCKMMKTDEKNFIREIRNRQRSLYDIEDGMNKKSNLLF